MLSSHRSNIHKFLTSSLSDLRPAAAKRPARRLLKKELSLDTYSWQKKYAHLTSSVMMAQVDERLKRRFSVSTSMEEISKIAEMKSIGSQQNIGNPEQAALAQSQHFDQLEALWNKRSPPRRRMNQVRNKVKIVFFLPTKFFSRLQSLSRQSSLAEDRINSSDEDEFLEERSGGMYKKSEHDSFAVRPNSFPQARACKLNTLSKHNPSSFSFENNQPDLIREVLAKSLKPSQTENDLKRLEKSSFQSTSFGVLSDENTANFRKKLRKQSKSESLARVNEASKIKKNRRKDLLSRSCIAQ